MINVRDYDDDEIQFYNSSNKKNKKFRFIPPINKRSAKNVHFKDKQKGGLIK